MSIMSFFVIVIGFVIAGSVLFSVVSNFFYWYENRNSGECSIPLPKPGVFLCLSVLATSLAGNTLCGLLAPFGPLFAIRPGARGKCKDGEINFPPVILVHGLHNNASGMFYISYRLRRAGVSVSTFSYNSFFTPINSILNQLDDHVREVESLHPGHKPVIVGHSLGGILARAWLMRPENPSRAGGLITLGTPHGGSKLAVFAPTALAANLLPEAELIAELKKSPAMPFPCVALASPVDGAVLPAIHLVPPCGPEGGWKLRITPAVGHFSMLICPRVGDMVLEELRAFS